MGDIGNGTFKMGRDLKELQEKLSEAYGKDEAQRKVKNEDGIFYVGEEVELKGSRFKVQAIKSKKLILKLLPRKL